MRDKFVGLGDFSLSLSPEGYRRFFQADSFDISYTGAESNVCASLAMMGAKTKFVTRLPENEISKCAVSSLKRFGIDTENIAFGGERMGVIYTEKGASQRPSKVVYDRKHTSFAEAKEEDFDWEKIFSDAAWLHFTGITAALSDETAKLCKRACMEAHKRNVIVSCDLNYRKKLWSEEKAQRVMSDLMQYVDVVIGNEEDAQKVLGISQKHSDVLTGKLDGNEYIDTAEQIYQKYGISRIAFTLRKSITASDNDWSAMLYDSGKAYFSREYKMHIVNRVGGGDSFAAGLIYSLMNGYDPGKAIEFAAAASCLKHTIEYDVNLSTVDEVMVLMNGDGSGRVQR